MARQLGDSSSAPILVTRSLSFVPAMLAHGSALTVAGLLLVSAGQPLFTEDTWWHLGMGEAYAAQGPWLRADPYLYLAHGPPAPAAWLTDLGFYGVERAFGFFGLRVAHVLSVATILWLAWSTLRRASGSALFASLGASAFAVLSAYRLFQLRPHLFTILAALLLLRLLVVDGTLPSWRRVAAAIGLLALWANLHGAFVLGPALLGAAVVGLGISALLKPETRDHNVERAKRLGVALGLGLVATLANPSGATQLLLYFTAGGDTPALGLVSDEWAPVRLFALPFANLPPSLLSWLLIWGLLLAGPAAVFLHDRAGRRGAAAVDPALVAVGALSLAAMLSAVRLLWLGVVALLVLGAAAQAIGILSSKRARWTIAIATGALIPAFWFAGDWMSISRGAGRSGYERPYPTVKYHAHAVWFLRDAGIEGNLFNDYFSGNFLGYWLAPRMKVFLNGSLNVPAETMNASAAAQLRRGAREGEDFLELLDRHRADVFFGYGVPVVSPANRPRASTTTHLEDAPGWVLVFRSLRNAVYLRKDARNRENLERVVEYYAREGVPFDPRQGFDPARVLREALAWGVEHGLASESHRKLQAAARSRDPTQRHAARERLLTQYALLGLYERVVAVDGQVSLVDPGAVLAGRRLLWSLLHLRRVDESLEAADRLAAIAPATDAMSRLLVDTAHHAAQLPEAEAASLVATLPVFTPPQIQRSLTGFREPEARTRCGPPNDRQ